MIPRVHDVVQLRDGTWAVVRRARETSGIPVGVRGARRSERFARIVDASQIVCVVTPEAAAALAPPREHRIFTALADVLGVAHFLGLRVGATGACGYELASGIRTLHEDSDLDIIIRAAFDDSRLSEFAFALRDVGVRLDIEVLLDDGCGAALAELLRGGKVLVKTPDGPALW